MIEEQTHGACEVCCLPIDDCICPECRSCGEVGDPSCYPELVPSSPKGCNRRLNHEQWKHRRDAEEKA